MGLDQFVFKTMKEKVGQFRKHADLQGYFDDIWQDELGHDESLNSCYVEISVEMCEDIINRTEYCIEFLRNAEYSVNFTEIPDDEHDYYKRLSKVTPECSETYDDELGFKITQGFFFGESSLAHHIEALSVFKNIYDEIQEDSECVFQYYCWW